MKKRNHAFDLLCGICIIRMVSLHTMQQCGKSNEDWWLEIMQWSYFFMSFFFFKAGYFNKSVTAMPSKAYVLDKAKRLFLPFLAAGTIGNLIYFALQIPVYNKYHHLIPRIQVEHIWENSGFYGNPPVWFLFSFFVTYILIHFFEKLRLAIVARRLPPYAAQATSLVYALFPLVGFWLCRNGNPLWFDLDNVFMGIFFFELGRTWHRIMDHLSPGITITISLLLITGFVVGNIVFHDAAYAMSNNKFTGDFLPVMFNTSAILCGLSGFLIAANVPRVPWISFIGEHSMVYFISHFPMLFFYRLVHISFGRSIYGRYDDVIILLPAIFMICSWLVPYIERTPWLSGRWKKA